MPQYFKKGSFGRMVETTDIDQEAIEVRMDRDEWTDYCAELDMVKMYQARTARSAQNLTRELEDAKRQIDDLQQQLRQAQADYSQLEKDIEQANEDKSAAFDQSNKQKELNKGLLRIIKERSNSMRGIVPKKSHSGYVVLYCAQYTYRYTVNQSFDQWRRSNPGVNKSNYQRIVHYEVPTWHSVIQTPHPATLSFDLIADQIWQELTYDCHVMSNLGITRCVAQELNGAYYKVQGAKCGLFKWAYRANLKSGLWEIDWYTTGPLIVPPEYFPPQKAKKQSRGS